MYIPLPCTSLPPSPHARPLSLSFFSLFLSLFFFSSPPFLPLRRVCSSLCVCFCSPQPMPTKLASNLVTVAAVAPIVPRRHPSLRPPIASLPARRLSSNPSLWSLRPGTSQPPAGLFSITRPPVTPPCRLRQPRDQSLPLFLSSSVSPLFWLCPVQPPLTAASGESQPPPSHSISSPAPLRCLSSVVATDPHPLSSHLPLPLALTTPADFPLPSVPSPPRRRIAVAAASSSPLQLAD